MKGKILLLSIGVAACGLTACLRDNDYDYRTLAPITVTAASDTINTDLGERLEYKGLKVESGPEVRYEWAYGRPKKGTSLSDHQFDAIETISESPEIGYVFTKVGTFLLRLKLDNGERILLKYFTLNVNSGFDEGIAVLSNDREGRAALSFLKTLTAEEEAQGRQSFYPDVFGSVNPEYALTRGTDLYVSDQPGASYAKLLIATDNEDGRIYQLDASSLEVLSTVSLQEFGTRFKEFGGERASGKSLANYCLGEDGRPYRYDMDLGFLSAATDMDVKFDRAVESVFRKGPGKASDRQGLYFGRDAVGLKVSSTSWKLFSAEGYEVVNVGCKRTMTSFSDHVFYLLFRSKADKDSYKIISTRDKLNLESERMTFRTEHLKMDASSKFVGTLASSDVYYTYDNAVYRWNLVSPPASEPAITVPEGEIIRDIATNFKGKAGDAGGEDVLYVATFNPGSGRGSLYVYRFSDNGLVREYKDKFGDPASVIYKYRTN